MTEAENVLTLSQASSLLVVRVLPRLEVMTKIASISVIVYPTPAKFGERIGYNSHYYEQCCFPSTLRVMVLSMLRLDAQYGEICFFLPVSFVKGHFHETGIAALLFRLLRPRHVKKSFENID